MPRKTGRPRRSSSRTRNRFNEAAARCRGKPAHGQRRLPDARLASMRPRPDAAENPQKGGNEKTAATMGFNEAAARCRGKPPAIACSARSARRFNEAAARCRGKPGSRAPGSRRVKPCFNEAAARCRGKPPAVSRVAGRPRRRFNEAAARCRGKPASAAQHGGGGETLQ